jgi:hypothetical protein
LSDAAIAELENIRVLLERGLEEEASAVLPYGLYKEN